MSSANASSNTLAGLALGVDLSQTLDPLFYGYAVAIVLFGITIVQVWIYLNTNHDKWPLRVLVYALFLLDFATTCLDSAALHQYLVSNFGNLLNLLKISKFLIAELLLTLIIIVCVEFFFASRVYLLGRFHWIVPALIVLNAIGGFIAGIVAVVDLYKHDVLTTFSTRQEKITLSFSLALSAASDIIATGALSWAFAQSRTGIKRTDTLLQKLFQYTVTRGFFVSVDQTVLLILILVSPERFWWMPFHLSVSKVYVITMVAMLNSRETLHNLVGSVVTDTDMTGTTSSSSGFGGGGIGGSFSKAKARLHGLSHGGRFGSTDLGSTGHGMGHGTGSGNVISTFPKSKVGRKQSDMDMSDSYIEMNDYEPKVVLITRETASEVL